MIREAEGDRISDADLRSICAELERALKAGESAGAESAFASHPELHSDSNAALEVIYTEFVGRELLGQRPTPDDFLERFPQWREGLEQLFQIHRVAGGASVLRSSATPSPDRVPTLAAREGEPRRVGNYEILGELGR